MPRMLLVTVAVLGLLAGSVLAQEPAACKVMYPPYAMHEEEAQYVEDPSGEGAWDMRMFSSKHANGADAVEFGRLTISPGQGWPVHRHYDADEWIYCLGGDGMYAYWALENAEVTEVPIAQGSVLFNPQNQLHKIWNVGSEPLYLLTFSKSLAPYENLGGWPETADGGVGVSPPVAPWESTCPPGQEADEVYEAVQAEAEAAEAAVAEAAAGGEEQPLAEGSDVGAEL